MFYSSKQNLVCIKTNNNNLICLSLIGFSVVSVFQVFIGLGFPYEGPAPIEAIALGCIFLQPRFDPPHTSDNNNFYKGKPTTRKVKKKTTKSGKKTL